MIRPIRLYESRKILTKDVPDFIECYSKLLIKVGDDYGVENGFYEDLSNSIINVDRLEIEKVLDVYNKTDLYKDLLEDCDICYKEAISSNESKSVINEGVHELKDEISEILSDKLPNFKTSVTPIKILGDEQLKITIAIPHNGVDYHIVSLCLHNDMELEPQAYGGVGGGSIYVKPDRNDPKQKYLAYHGVKIPFIKPKKDRKYVMSAIGRFCDNYKDTLVKYKDRLPLPDGLDLDKFVG